MRQGVFLNISFEPPLIKSPGQLIGISKDNIFLKSFERFGGLGLSCKSFSIYPLLQLLVKIPGFHFFKNGNKGQLKVVNVNYEKMSELAILSF